MKSTETKEVVVHKPQDIFVSVVIVLRSEAKSVKKYVQEVSKVLSSAYTNYEIIIVDNGVSAKEFTAVANLLEVIPCIRLIKLSQQFKYDTAVFAGLEVSIGDFVCTVDPEIDAVKNIPVIVKKNRKHEVIQGVSKVPIKGVFGSQLGRRLFYWYNRRYIGIDIPLNATYHASFTRRAINSLTTTSRNHRHIRHLARRIGYTYSIHPYTPLKNPSNHRRFRTGIIEGLEIITSYSSHPLRFVTWLGVIASLINVLYAFYVLFLNVFGRDLAPGWTSTSMQLSLMFFILFIILIILSEYVGRILNETHRDPHYYIADELVSTIAISDVDRKNVTK